MSNFSSRSRCLRTRALVGRRFLLGACWLLAVVALARAQVGSPVTAAPNPPLRLSAPPAVPASAAAPGAANPVSAGNSAGVAAPAGYVLGTDDQVQVDVFGEDDLRAGGRLSAEGSLNLPLLGPVKLGGLTTAQAAARVTELLKRDYLVNPRVGVSLVAYARRRFTVLGQIGRPGSYDMPEDAAARGGIDLLEAVAMAGGYTRLAAPERIDVVRRKGGGDNASSERIRVNAKKLARGGQGSGGFLVLPGDTINVGESIF